MAHELITYLDYDWRRAVETVRQAAARLWATPAHRHAVVYLNIASGWRSSPRMRAIVVRDRRSVDPLESRGSSASS